MSDYGYWGQNNYEPEYAPRDLEVRETPLKDTPCVVRQKTSTGVLIATQDAKILHAVCSKQTDKLMGYVVTLNTDEDHYASLDELVFQHRD